MKNREIKIPEAAWSKNIEIGRTSAAIINMSLIIADHFLSLRTVRPLRSFHFFFHPLTRMANFP